jgi:hypothetical protein
MYATVLLLHSWLRWLVILLGVWAVVSAAGRSHGGGSRRAGASFTMALDVQFLLGVLLYGALSPITRAAMADMGAAMRNDSWRFWAVEHPALMILAVIFAHVARSVARRKGAAGPASQPSRAPMVWYAMALIAVLAAIPWPFVANARPLLRW